MIVFSPICGTRRAVVWGTMWGLAVAVLESLAMPPERWASIQLLLWWLTYWVVPLWCGAGILLLLLLTRAEREAGWPGIAGAFVAVWPLLGIAQPAISDAMMNLSASFPALQAFAKEMGVLPLRESWGAIGLYDTWVYVFYGGILVMAYVLTIRAERTRSLLHESAMARSRSEELLDAERLRVLQAQIDPTLLLETMRELEQRYRSDPVSAERLLEVLVEFLRCAMHGLRIPTSTLEAELRLARTFAHLQHERGITNAWRVSDDQCPLLATMTFPSLLMLRLLALGGEHRPMLRVQAEGSRTVLAFYGLAHEVSAELRHQVRTQLNSLYGERFKLEYSPASPGQMSFILER